jgi:hypothetical protein
VIATDCYAKSQDRAVMKPVLPDAPAEKTLAICLALIAGYVDGYGLCALATCVSFMSGNTTQSGVMTGQRNFLAALPSVLAMSTRSRFSLAT